MPERTMREEVVQTDDVNETKGGIRPSENNYGSEKYGLVDIYKER